MNYGALTARRLVNYMKIINSEQRLIQMTLAVFNLICSHLLKFNSGYVEGKYLK